MTNNKPEVKRYDPEGYNMPPSVSGTDTHMNEHPQGDYVLAYDYEVLQVECEKLRKDADRYRWLRDGNNEENSEATLISVNFYGDEWDEMIDAAMQEENK